MVDRRAATLVIAFVFGAFALVGRWAVERRLAEHTDTTTAAAPPEPSAPGPVPEAGEVWRVPAGGAPSRGPADAPVTVVVFTDLGAATGARLEAMLGELARERPEDVRYFVRLMVTAETQLTGEALLAAQMQGRYFEMRRALGERAGTALTRRDIDDAARAVGLDMGLLAAALDGGKAGARARADARLAAALGVTAPTLFVNGEKVPGNVSAAQLGQVVTRQKSRAEALVRRGIPRDRVYVELTRSGRSDTLDPTAKRAPRRREDPDAVYRVDLGDSPVRGPADALVTIVEFADFQDPFSARAASTLADLLEQHRAELRLVWKDSPMSTHPEARAASVAARAAHVQGRFWPMHDALFAAQSTLGRETYEQLARQLHLNMERFHADLGSDRLGKAVLQERETAEPLGVVAVPVFFVNGKRLRGFRSPADLIALVSRELERARALVRTDHVRPADVYDRLTREGARRSVFIDAAPVPDR